jgi:uncharacterized FlaG/YvyC family protein
MINKFLKIIGSILLVGAFLFIAFGSGSDSDEKIKIDINDTKALENYMQGKLSLEKHTGDINHTWRYRFEIKGNKLRIWRCWNNTDDPFDMSDGYEEFNFTLGSPTRDVDGYHARYLEFAVFDKTNNFGGVYNSLSPFWIVSDDHWDTPVLRCASGIPTWSKEEFQVTENRITHNEYTTSESSYSTSNNYDDNSNETQSSNVESDSTYREDVNDMSSNIKSADDNVKDNLNIKIGKHYEGGLVFYIDNTGEHGLVCSKILSGQEGNNFEEAKNLCDNYISVNFKDWYLPSIDELKLLYSQKNSIKFLKSDIYELVSSSTKYQLWDGGNWALDFNDGGVYGVNPKSSFGVIAIRKF